jgi:4-amino-4-deoxy-L-arabinose transferase-like glycosyltransferase
LLLAAASGAALGLGSLVKLYAVLALPTVVLLLMTGTARAVAGCWPRWLGFAVPILVTALANARAIPELWDGVVTYHRNASSIEISTTSML